MPLLKHKNFLDIFPGMHKIRAMDDSFYRFWDKPLEWVAAQAKILGIDVKDLVRREAGIDPTLWGKWESGKCEPTFRRFKPVVYAIERLHLARRGTRKAASRRRPR